MVTFGQQMHQMVLQGGHQKLQLILMYQPAQIIHTQVPTPFKL